MKQVMQQQAQNKNTQNNEQHQDTSEGSPQSKPTIKKRLFNIKKTKFLRQKKSLDIFNNPIYAGLVDEEFNNDNIDNFGPWVRQIQLKNLNNNKDYMKKQKLQTAQNFKQRLLKYQIQNQDKIAQQEMLANQNIEEDNPQNFNNFNSTRINNFQNIARNTRHNLQENTLPSLIRSKSQIQRLQQIKYTSVDLNQYVPLSKNHDLTISKRTPFKISKFKHSHSGSLGNLNIIQKYFNQKQSLSLLKKRSNVIYNYCCRDNFQSDNFLHLVKQRKTEQKQRQRQKQKQKQKNIFKEKYFQIQKKFNKTIQKPLNHIQLYHQLKKRRNSNSNSNTNNYKTKTVRLKQ